MHSCSFRTHFIAGKMVSPQTLREAQIWTLPSIWEPACAFWNGLSLPYSPFVRASAGTVRKAWLFAGASWVCVAASSCWLSVAPSTLVSDLGLLVSALTEAAAGVSAPPSQPPFRSRRLSVPIERPLRPGRVPVPDHQGCNQFASAPLSIVWVPKF